jgi:hypothetical protein
MWRLVLPVAVVPSEPGQMDIDGDHPQIGQRNHHQVKMRERGEQPIYLSIWMYEVI